MLNVALQSVRRFHPLAGYFALLPRVDPHAKCPVNFTIDDCSARGLLRSWSGSFIKPLTLPRHKETLFDLPVRSSWSSSMEGNRANDGVTFVYSRMTFLRHWVPQVLALRGYTFSVSLDPDTLCVRAWDLRVLQRVELLSGRPVGTSARTKGLVATGIVVIIWDIHKFDNSATEDKILQHQLLKRRTELNGGVLVFNNSECMRVRWGQTLAKYYAKLNDVVEGDQDLMSLVLAAEPSFGRYLLPSVYNYAFRRDRERLPYTLAHRLRHGLVGHQVVSTRRVDHGSFCAGWQAMAAAAAYELPAVAACGAPFPHHRLAWDKLARSWTCSAPPFPSRIQNVNFWAPRRKLSSKADERTR